MLASLAPSVTAGNIWADQIIGGNNGSKTKYNHLAMAIAGNASAWHWECRLLIDPDIGIAPHLILTLAPLIRSNQQTT